jgi:serine/threonine protein kinase HipA of HipAB toxin-antitoxin module
LFKEKIFYLFLQKIKTMAVTRLQRKERRNKTRARVRTENIKLHKSRVFIKSPYADVSGIIIDENAPVMEAAPVAAAVVVEEVVEEVAAAVEETVEDQPEAAAEGSEE